MRLLMAALAAFGLAACGGGGSDAITSSAPTSSEAQATPLVVEIDVTGDETPDVLTLDTTETPFRIVEAIQGVQNGKPIDATGLLAGQTIDPDLSEALAKHLADSLNVASRTELELVDSQGRTIPVTVFE